MGQVVNLAPPAVEERYCMGCALTRVICWTCGVDRRKSGTCLMDLLLEVSRLTHAQQRASHHSGTLRLLQSKPAAGQKEYQCKCEVTSIATGHYGMSAVRTPG
ncbi:hypothetical protein AALO_G00303070 [Alosa alosa]|uniref:Uncharacterized protein n=1 Tax=Alosa alosa TaxID=278164 RepID=A0AAV6FFX4_9TELE|nr:hypothetical protein AALO_G00303070 [Alosa alosa]